MLRLTFVLALLLGVTACGDDADSTDQGADVQDGGVDVGAAD